MPISRSYDDPILGHVLVTVNARSRRFVFRSKDDGLHVTAPVGYSDSELQKAIQELMPRLQKMMQRHDERSTLRTIDASFRIDVPDFTMDFRQSKVGRVQARFMKGHLEILYPEGHRFEAPDFQQWVIRITEEALRHQSQRILIPRLSQLARQYGFKFQRASIHKTHGRWGSCSSRGSINLSLYLLLLPPHLRDYVMLHELCHTHEMNHSPRFWSLLDTFTDNRSQELRNEMKHYDTSIFYQSSFS